MPIFYSPKHREYVAIKSDPNSGVSWVERAMLVNGGIIRQNLSPYFISNEEPIGEQGRIRRALMKEYDWSPGTYDDATESALRYMKRVGG